MSPAAFDKELQYIPFLYAGHAYGVVSSVLASQEGGKPRVRPDFFSIFYLEDRGYNIVIRFELHKY